MNKIDKDGFRWYQTPNELELPSSTTIIDCIQHKGLKNWFINSSANKVKTVQTTTADTGNLIHEYAEQIVRGDAPKNIRHDLEYIMHEFYTWWEVFNDTHDVHVSRTEQPLHCYKYGYAGTCDMVLKVDGVIEIWDWKSGSVKVNAGWQLASYVMAYEEMFNVTVGGMRVVQISAKYETIKEFKYEHLEFCKRAFLHSLQAWKALYFGMLKKQKYPYLLKDPFELREE